MKSNWPTKKLGEICEKIKSGGTPRRSLREYWNGNISFVKIEDITHSRKYIFQTIEKITEKGLQNSNAWILPENSILLSIYAIIGEVAINKIPVTTNQAILGIIPKKEILVDYLFYYLKKFGRQLIKYNIQSTQKNITLAVVKNLEISLPPLPIQQKIVYVLDTIQEVIGVQEKIIEKTKELKKSMMADLFKYGGPSFREGRKLKKTEIGEIPEDWEVVKIGNYLKVLRNGLSKKQNTSNGIPVTRIETIAGDKIDPTKVGYINDVSEEEIALYRLRIGDILFSHINSEPQLGRSVIYEGIPEIILHGMNLLLLRTKPELNSQFLNYLFNFYRERGIFISIASRAVNQSSINQGKIKILKIPLPSLNEQQEIAEIFQTIDQKIEIEQKKKALYEELFKTMLNKLMSGEIDLEKIKF